MIILDLNQVMISTLMASIGNHTNMDIDEDLLRHMILNTIRANVKKFKGEYRDLVIACDDKNYWRKDFFPHYKAHRKKDREKSELDWNKIFKILNQVRDDLKEYFPYPVIQVERAEADDIIGTLAQALGDTTDVLILSGDKDFIQLHKYKNVKQYNPILKKFVNHDDPVLYLKEHIIKGDRGDGIPNIASPDDVFVTGGRQKPLRKAMYQALIQSDIDQVESGLDNFKRNWQRNRTLVDLSQTPPAIVEKVFEEYNKQGAKKNRIMEYFTKRKLSSLLESIGDF